MIKVQKYCEKKNALTRKAPTKIMVKKESKCDTPIEE